MTENGVTVNANGSSDLSLNQILFEMTGRLAGMEAKLEKVNTVEHRLGKLEDEVKDIGKTLHSMQSKEKQYIPWTMKLTALGAIVAMLLGGISITNTIKENNQEQAKNIYLQNKLDELQKEVKQ